MMKEKKEKRKKKNTIRIFGFNFFDCEEKSWNSGTISRGTVVPLKYGLGGFKMCRNLGREFH